MRHNKQEKAEPRQPETTECTFKSPDYVGSNVSPHILTELRNGQQSS